MLSRWLDILLCWVGLHDLEHIRSGIGGVYDIRCKVCKKEWYEEVYFE